MFARISTWHGWPEDLEKWVARGSEAAKPILQQQPGFAAAYWLVDREGRKGLTITFWESEEAMRASDTSRSQNQAQISRDTWAVATIESFEVFDHT